MPVTDGMVWCPGCKTPVVDAHTQPAPGSTAHRICPICLHDFDAPADLPAPMGLPRDPSMRPRVGRRRCGISEHRKTIHRMQIQIQAMNVVRGLLAEKAEDWKRRALEAEREVRALTTLREFGRWAETPPTPPVPPPPAPRARRWNLFGR